MAETEGKIFNIQRFSTHDGPGIRTSIFLKGCSLNCAWCHNPESISSSDQLQYFPELCTNCGECANVCSRQACIMENGTHQLIRSKCVLCGDCAGACVFQSLVFCGRSVTVEDTMTTVRKDKSYYENSGGGITVSGGEPLLQPAFVSKLLHQARAEDIHTAVDTALHVQRSVVQQIAEDTDLFLIDIKSFNNDIHQKWTGAGNAQILDNFQYLLGSGCKMHIRIPMVKGITDGVADMRSIAEMIAGRPNVLLVELLPYHSYGVNKAESIGVTQEEFSAPSNDKLEMLKDVLRNKAIPVYE